MDPAPPRPTSSEVMSPSGPRFATPASDHGQDGADLLPAMTSIMNGVSPPQPLVGLPTTTGTSTSMSGPAGRSSSTVAPRTGMEAMPTNAVEAAVQAQQAPQAPLMTQGAVEHRLLEGYGSTAQAGVVDQRRSPLSSVSHQLEVVMQSGVQWFREAWRTRPGPPSPAHLTTTPSPVTTSRMGVNQGEPRADGLQPSPVSTRPIPPSWSNGCRGETGATALLPAAAGNDGEIS